MGSVQWLLLAFGGREHLQFASALMDAAYFQVLLRPEVNVFELSVLRKEVECNFLRKNEKKNQATWPWKRLTRISVQKCASTLQLVPAMRFFCFNLIYAQIKTHLVHSAHTYTQFD